MNKDKEYFIENLSILIDSGIDILNALKSLEEEARSKSMKKTIGNILKDIDAGSSLSKAIADRKILPAANIALIQIGESSGQLAENLNLIANQNQKERSFTSKIRSAMMYPVMILSVTFVVGIGISWFILPKLAQVFTDLKLKLPLITQLMINFGIFLSKNGAYVVPLSILGMFLLLYFLFVYPKTKFIGENILFSLPVIKKLIQEVEVARFGYLLGTLLDAGIPIQESLDSIVSSPGLNSYKKLYRHLNVSIQQGNTFKKSFDGYKNSRKYIPYFVQQMVAAGEFSGNLSKSLQKISKVYEEKTENNAKNLTVILEPLLLVFISLAVLGVAIAVILPIYSLVGGINN